MTTNMLERITGFFELSLLQIWILDAKVDIDNEISPSRIFDTATFRFLAQNSVTMFVLKGVGRLQNVDENSDEISREQRSKFVCLHYICTVL